MSTKVSVQPDGPPCRWRGTRDPLPRRGTFCRRSGSSWKVFFISEIVNSRQPTDWPELTLIRLTDYFIVIITYLAIFHCMLGGKLKLMYTSCLGHHCRFPEGCPRSWAAQRQRYLIRNEIMLKSHSIIGPFSIWAALEQQHKNVLSLGGSNPEWPSLRCNYLSFCHNFTDTNVYRLTDFHPTQQQLSLIPSSWLATATTTTREGPRFKCRCHAWCIFHTWHPEITEIPL